MYNSKQLKNGQVIEEYKFDILWQICKKFPILRRKCHNIGNFASLLASVDLGQTALTGFTETVIQVDAGLVHGTADHVIADISGTGQIIAQIACVHSAACGYSVAFDAGNLYQTADGVTSQTQMVFHCHFCCVFHLIQILVVQFSQRSGSHGTSCANFRLTAALGAGDRCVALGPEHISKLRAGHRMRHK